jgi:glycerophosphoryl diester phosphodiesterase
MPKAIFDRPIAHRGLHNKSAGVIENSRSAFAAAIAGNFAIECDLQLSSDGVPIVFHDQKLERLTGRTGLVRETTAAEMGSYPLAGSAAGDCPQTFNELLAQTQGKVLLQVELKHQTSPEATRKLAQAAVASARAYHGPLVFESFDPDLLVEARKAGYTGALGIITWRYDQPDDDTGGMDPWRNFLMRHLLHWPRTRFDFISCDKNALDLPAIRFWHSLGMTTASWTIRSQAEADAALAHADQIVFEGFSPAGA